MSDMKLSAAQMLRQARLDREWTLEQVCGQTRIPKEQIQALEECNWAALPGAPYARAFCKTLAQAYELDSEAVLAGLRNDMGLAPSTEGKPGKSQLPIGVETPSEEVARSRTPLIMAGLLLLALLLVLAATRIGSMESIFRAPTDTLHPRTDSVADTLPSDTAASSHDAKAVLVPAAVPAQTAPTLSSPIVQLSAVDTDKAVFVLYVRQGINKVRKKTLGLGDTLSFDPDTAIYIHSISHRPLRLRGAIHRDSIETSCFRVDRKSDTVRFSPIAEEEWQKMADAIKRLKRKSTD